MSSVTENNDPNNAQSRFNFDNSNWQNQFLDSIQSFMMMSQQSLSLEDFRRESDKMRETLKKTQTAIAGDLGGHSEGTVQTVAAALVVVLNCLGTSAVKAHNQFAQDQQLMTPSNNEKSQDPTKKFAADAELKHLLKTIVDVSEGILTAVSTGFANTTSSSGNNAAPLIAALEKALGALEKVMQGQLDNSTSNIAEIVAEILKAVQQIASIVAGSKPHDAKSSNVQLKDTLNDALAKNATDHFAKTS